MQLAVALPALLLAGCAVGPNYSRPAVPAPPQFRGDRRVPATAKSLADTKWFDLFHDDALKQLVETRAASRISICRIAAERVLEARAQLGVMQSARLPKIDATGGFNLNRGSRIGASPFVPAGLSLDTSYTQAGFSLGWELDVWGRVRRLNEAARAQYLASEEGAARRGHHADRRRDDAIFPAAGARSGAATSRARTARWARTICG